MKSRVSAMLLGSLASLPSLALAQPRPVQRPVRPAPAVPLTNYTVQAGDTCTAIALRRYRSAARTDLIHTNNPSLGLPPHRLRVGQVLRLPVRVPPSREPIPVALVTETQNRVEVINDAGSRAAHRSDPLFRGTRVSTLERSSAEVTFADETQLRLSEQTLVVILGETNTRVRRLATARDTVLERGSLRAFLGTLGAQSAAPTTTTTNGTTTTTTTATVVAPNAIAVTTRTATLPRRPPPRPVSVPIRTATGRVVLSDGEASVSIGERNATTVAVYSGRASVSAGRRTVTVNPGFAVRAAEGGQIAPPHALPVAPVWGERPTPLSLTDATVTLRASWTPGAAPAGRTVPSPAQWHVQVARDPSFLDLVAESRVDDLASPYTRAEMAAGRYYVRASAIDGERFEGPFTDALTMTVVSPRVVPLAAAHQASLTLPGGLFCGLDEAPLEATETRPITFNHLQAHTLRCATEASSTAPATWAVAPETRGPFTVVARLVDADALARTGRVRVQVVDHAGDRMTFAQLAGRSSEAGVRAEAPTAGEEPTVAVFPVRWDEGAQRFVLQLTVDQRESAETQVLTLPEAPPAVPVARDGAAARWTVRAEGYGGRMLPTYQRNSDSAQFDGNTLAMTWGVGGALRVGFDLLHTQHGQHGPSLAAVAGVGGWYFPRGSGEAGQASSYTLGLRLVPYMGTRVSPWVEAAGGATYTGALVRVALEAGVGLDVRVGRSLRVGPMVRYFQIVQPEGDAYPVDARVLSLGVGASWQFGQ